MEGFQRLVTLTLAGSSHTAYRHASLIDLYLHAKFSLKSKKLLVEGRTYGRTFEIHFISLLRRVDLKIAVTQNLPYDCLVVSSQVH